MVGLPFRLGIDLMAHANMQTKLHIVKRVYRLWAVWGGKRIIEKRQAEFEIGERFVFLVPPFSAVALECSEKRAQFVPQQNSTEPNSPVVLWGHHGVAIYSSSTLKFRVKRMNVRVRVHIKLG